MRGAAVASVSATILLFASAFAACIGDDPAPTGPTDAGPAMGDRFGRCFPDDQCKSGLVCRDGICLRPDDPPPDGASPSDGGADAADTSAPDATDDSGSLVPNGGFEETAASECGPFWEVRLESTDAAISAAARSGKQSCMICNTGPPDGVFGVRYTVPKGEWGPGRYTLVFYARANGSNVLAVSQLTVDLSDGGVSYPSATGQVTAQSWLQLKIVTDLSAGDTVHSVDLGGNDATGACLRLDDVTVVRQ